MYLLYLDDSGSAENAKEEHFVLGGVCLEDKKLYYINRSLDDMAKRIDAVSYADIEFHACEIFSGRSVPWSLYRDRADRAQIIKDVLDVVNKENNGLTLFSCAVHKKSFVGVSPVEKAFEDICSRFDMFLKRKQIETGIRQHGLIIFDKSSYESSLQGLSRVFKTKGTAWRVIERVNEVPLFVDSRQSRAVQLADHIAYAVYRRYEHADLNYFNVIEGCFDMENGTVHGLSHIQTNSPKCTCPYCLQRK